MDLRRTGEQQLLAGTMREFLERECPVARVRQPAFDPDGDVREVWSRMAELGWPGLPFAFGYGGLEMGFLDLCIVIEELGRFLVAEPFVSTVALCGLAIDRFGTPAQREQHLPAIAAGRRIMAYAETEAESGWDPGRVRLTARDEGDHYALDGTKILVPHAHVADTLLVVGREQGADPTALTAFLVDAGSPGISLERQETIGFDHRSQVVLQGVRVPRAHVLGEPGGAWPIVDAIQQWGAAAKCAEMLGGAERVLEMTLEYARERRQFGRPIGSFQAVQHHCANMAADILGTRHLVYEAAWRCTEGEPARRTVSMAKAWTGEAYQRVCALSHQVHGAIGFTGDHDLPLYFRHAQSADLDFGDGDHHRELVLQDLGL